MLLTQNYTIFQYDTLHKCDPSLCIQTARSLILV